jgi:hypothetical protein
MKARRLFYALVLLTAAMPLANAAEPVTTTPKDEPAMAMPEHHTDTQSMMERAQKAKTPAERNKLMAENMAIMKAHMEKMHQHMAMMHEMMERLMIQQELMMKASAK